MKHLLMIMLLSSCLALIACGGTGKEEGKEAEGEAKTEAGAEAKAGGETTAAGTTDSADAKAPAYSKGSYNISFQGKGLDDKGKEIQVIESGKAYVVHSADKSQTIVSVSVDGWPKSLCTLYTGDTAGKSTAEVKGFVSVEKKGEVLSLKGKDGKLVPLSVSGTGFPPTFAALKSQCGL